jgi:hypothetical protein
MGPFLQFVGAAVFITIATIAAGILLFKIALKVMAIVVPIVLIVVLFGLMFGRREAS